MCRKKLNKKNHLSDKNFFLKFNCRKCVKKKIFLEI